MNYEIWIGVGVVGVGLAVLAVWLGQAVAAELQMTDEWWTPKDPATRARRDVEKLLREANKS